MQNLALFLAFVPHDVHMRPPLAVGTGVAAGGASSSSGTGTTGASSWALLAPRFPEPPQSGHATAPLRILPLPWQVGHCSFSRSESATLSLADGSLFPQFSQLSWLVSAS